MGKSTKPKKPAKPKKPRPDFPLFAHRNGQWAKKIQGKLHYFGVCGDAESALNSYLDRKDHLHAGGTPRIQADGLTMRDLLDRFMTSKKLQVDAGELSPHSWADYHQTCAWVGEFFGLTRLIVELHADDSERLKAALTRTCGPVTVGNEVQRVRVLFNCAYKQGLIDKPIRYRPAFTRPSRKVMRLERARKGPKRFTAPQVRALIRKASAPLRATIRLGVNTGFGNNDCATLRRQGLDLNAAWVTHPRPKTGIMRRCPSGPKQSRHGGKPSLSAQRRRARRLTIWCS